MSWKTNAIMYWSDDNTTWHMITDHNRQPLTIAITRIGTDNRMVDGSLRRYAVAKKQVISTSWQNTPSLEAPSGNGMGTVDGGYGGNEIKTWHDNHDGSFFVKLRKGLDQNKAVTDGSIEVIKVMITDFSHDVIKRGINVDTWNISLTLEEV